MHDNEGDELYDDDKLWENIIIFEWKVIKKAKNTCEIFISYINI